MLFIGCLLYFVLLIVLLNHFPPLFLSCICNLCTCWCITCLYIYTAYKYICWACIEPDSRIKCSVISLQIIFSKICFLFSACVYILLSLLVLHCLVLPCMTIGIRKLSKIMFLMQTSVFNAWRHLIYCVENIKQKFIFIWMIKTMKAIHGCVSKFNNLPWIVTGDL